MPDLDGGGYRPPLYRSGRFSSQILRLNPLQIGRGHDRYGLGMMLADKRDKDQSKNEKDNGGDEKEMGLKERKDNR
jgi:hypothetical protein